MARIYAFPRPVAEVPQTELHPLGAGPGGAAPASEPVLESLAPECLLDAPLAPARPPRALSEAETVLQDKMLRAYFAARRPSRNHTAATIAGDLRVVRDLLTYIGQPLWEMTEGDFEVWAAHLQQERKLAPKTQRRYQGAVATLFKYLVAHTALQNEAFQEFAGRVILIAHEENRVIHNTEANHKRARTYLTAEQFTDLIRVLDAAIKLCLVEHPRRVRALIRDKAMFITFYAYGLRLSEGYGLSLNSFRRNPDLRELGPYGFAHVYGKGSNGSGPRFRAVPAINKSIREVLQWYLKEVRPQYPLRDPDEDALWLSEQGARLCRSSIAARFKVVLTITGHDPKMLSTHGLRHMSVSHEAEANVPLHFTQVRHGHRHGSTTQQYTHLPEHYIRDQARRLVRRMSEVSDE